MKLETKNIDEIKDAFASMRSKDDFLVLLNYCKKLLYGENYKPFEIKQLNYYSNVNVNRNRYFSFVVKKKSGDDRIIHAPKSGLKAIQKCLNLILQTVYQPHKAASGFVPGKSIVDNAKHHVGSIYVYNIDLKDFFPSVDQARIWGRLKNAPFNLNESNGNEILANIIAALCCQGMEVERRDENNNWINVIKNVLPQGAPTSPTITNIICERLDVRLTGVAKRFGLKYSRYADDITFSSMHNVYQNNSEFLAEVERIITDQNFSIKESKTRLQKQGYRQEVTGLLVNEKVNVQKRYIKQLRTWLYLWEKYSYEKANAYFLQHYISDKGHVKKNLPVMQNVIAGKLEYLKMIKGKENALYLKLKHRFDKLLASENPMEQILGIWEKEGIEKAMELYYDATNNLYENYSYNDDLLMLAGKNIKLPTFICKSIEKLKIALINNQKLHDEFERLVLLKSETHTIKLNQQEEAEATEELIINSSKVVTAKTEVIDSINNSDINLDNYTDEQLIEAYTKVTENKYENSLPIRNFIYVRINPESSGAIAAAIKKDYVKALKSITPTQTQKLKEVVVEKSDIESTKKQTPNIDKLKELGLDLLELTGDENKISLFERFKLQMDRYKLNDNSLKSYIVNEDVKEILIEDNIVKLISADNVLKLQLHVAKNRLSKLPQTFNVDDENEIIKWIIFHHPTNKKTYLAYIGDIETVSI